MFCIASSNIGKEVFGRRIAKILVTRQHFGVLLSFLFPDLKIGAGIHVPNYTNTNNSLIHMQHPQATNQTKQTNTYKHQKQYQLKQLAHITQTDIITATKVTTVGTVRKRTTHLHYMYDIRFTDLKPSHKHQHTMQNYTQSEFPSSNTHIYRHEIQLLDYQSRHHTPLQLYLHTLKQHNHQVQTT